MNIHEDVHRLLAAELEFCNRSQSWYSGVQSYVDRYPHHIAMSSTTLGDVKQRSMVVAQQATPGSDAATAAGIPVEAFLIHLFGTASVGTTDESPRSFEHVASGISKVSFLCEQRFLGTPKSPKYPATPQAMMQRMQQKQQEAVEGLGIEGQACDDSAEDRTRAVL